MLRRVHANSDPATEKVAAAVISYNSARDLPACLAALSAAAAVDMVVVIDNASTDGSPDVVRDLDDERIVLVEVGHNSGFAGGCNRAFQALPEKYQWLAFLNPDVVVDGECLTRCAQALAAAPQTAGVAPRLMRAAGSTVDSVGQVLRQPTLEVSDRGYGQPISNGLLASTPVLAACGALAVFRRQALESVTTDAGPWAEHFFCFWEDLELGWRLTNRGWSILALPTAVARHGRGAGAAAGSGPLRWRRGPELEACVLSNRWMTLIRHLHSLDLLTRLPLLLAWDLLAVTAGVLRRPRLARCLGRRMPLVINEWKDRQRNRHPQRRLKNLLWQSD